jgi:hypothetical protein
MTGTTKIQWIKDPVKDIVNVFELSASCGSYCKPKSCGDFCGEYCVKYEWDPNR